MPFGELSITYSLILQNNANVSQWKSSGHHILWNSGHFKCQVCKGETEVRGEGPDAWTHSNPECSGSVRDTVAGVWLPYRLGLNVSQLPVQGDWAAPFMCWTARRTSSNLSINAPFPLPQNRAHLGLVFLPGNPDWAAAMCSLCYPPTNISGYFTAIKSHVAGKRIGVT